MGGGSKSPSKRSPVKAKAVSGVRKRVTSKATVDEEASESDGIASPVISKAQPVNRKRVATTTVIDDEASDSDGVLVDGSASDRNSVQLDELDTYEKDFINDGDPYEGRTEPSDEEFPAALLPPFDPAPVKRTKKSRTKTGSVIDISSSSEEDLTAMDVDDSLFKKPSGVKSTALPPSLVTRSAKRAASSVASPAKETKKKAKTSPASSSSIVATADTVSVQLPAGGFKSQADIMSFMSQFMDQYLVDQAKNKGSTPDSETDNRELSSRERSVPRIDFDELELQKAIKASKAESYVKSTRGAGSSKTKESSPPWDPPYDGSSDMPSTDKGKGKAISSSSNIKKQKAASSSRRVAPDLISRVQSGVDMKEAPLPDTKDVVVPSQQPLTLEQYFAKHGSVSATADSIANVVERPVVDESEHPTVFMEELETYKTHYDHLALCGVNDEDLQDPVLANTYIGQPPLPAGRYILPVYDPARMSGQETEPIKGGRVKFSTWARHIRALYADNAIGAILFREATPNFINPSRVSPIRLSAHVSVGGASTQRLQVDNKIAVCVSAIFTTESFLHSARKIGVNSDRTRKWVSGIMHNQEWERAEAVFCLTFGEPLLYAQLTPKNALSFQTMMSPTNAAPTQDVEDAFANAPADMFAPVTPTKSPAKPKSPVKPWTFTSKTLLACTDKVPVYDARKTVIDFATDLERLDRVLPTYIGEIPTGSFVVVGYTVSSYKAVLSSGGDRVPHLGCNIVWAIVCGTPILKPKPRT
ncbi:hypothetical protein B0H13DRAFT_2455861 [Mycena leptocephala]|nr:hypothetical protein B0H13DRAFT_2455861 [Mycena leptocephala]